jgi:hypothetical protein
MAPSNVNSSIKGSAGKKHSIDSSAAAGEPEWPGAAEIWTAVERHQPHADMCEAMVVAGWLAGMGLEAYTKKLLEEGWNCLEVGPGDLFRHDIVTAAEPLIFTLLISFRAMSS